jgi:hypothetical protein
MIVTAACCSKTPWIIPFTGCLQRRQEELEQADEERRQRKKAKDAERRARLRAEGKLLSKSEREKQRMAKEKLEQMKALGMFKESVCLEGCWGCGFAAGIVLLDCLAFVVSASSTLDAGIEVAGLEEGDAPKKRPVYTKRKRGKKQASQAESGMSLV